MRHGRQMLQMDAVSSVPSRIDAVTVDSLLGFPGVATLPEETMPVFRLLVRFGRGIDSCPSWADLPWRLVHVPTRAHAIESCGTVSQVHRWLAERNDACKRTVILLDPQADPESDLEDLVGVLRSARSEIHLVAERPLDARERRLKADSVVLAPPGHSSLAAAQLFTALSADAASVLLTCPDRDDWRGAYGTADRPSRMIEAWWSGGTKTLFFATAEARSFFARSRKVMVTLYDLWPLQHRSALDALRELSEHEESICASVPLAFRRLDQDQRLDRRCLHLLCSAPVDPLSQWQSRL